MNREKINIINKDVELWDLYDERKNKIGKDQVRGEKIDEGFYHLVAHVWIKNSHNEYLMSKRSPSKRSYPLMWECVGGSALKGETSLETAIRETSEEVGVDLFNSTYQFVTSFVRKEIQDIVDVYLFNYDGIASLDAATTDEVVEVKWMTKDEITDLFKNNKLMPTLKYFFEIDKFNLK